MNTIEIRLCCGDSCLLSVLDSPVSLTQFPVSPMLSPYTYMYTRILVNIAH